MPLLFSLLCHIKSLVSGIYFQYISTNVFAALLPKTSHLLDTAKPLEIVCPREERINWLCRTAWLALKTCIQATLYKLLEKRESNHLKERRGTVLGGLKWGKEGEMCNYIIILK